MGESHDVQTGIHGRDVDTKFLTRMEISIKFSKCSFNKYLRKPQISPSQFIYVDLKHVGEIDEHV